MRIKGFAFVEFNAPESAAKAIEVILEYIKSRISIK